VFKASLVQFSSVHLCRFEHNLMAFLSAAAVRL